MAFSNFGATAEIFHLNELAGVVAELLSLCLLCIIRLTVDCVSSSSGLNVTLAQASTAFLVLLSFSFTWQQYLWIMALFWAFVKSNIIFVTKPLKITAVQVRLSSGDEQERRWGNVSPSRSFLFTWNLFGFYCNRKFKIWKNMPLSNQNVFKI